MLATLLHAIVGAIACSNVGDKKDGQPVLPLLKAGFNRRIQENVNEKEWLNELTMLEHNDLKNKVRSLSSRWIHKRSYRTV